MQWLQWISRRFSQSVHPPIPTGLAPRIGAAAALLAVLTLCSTHQAWSQPRPYPFVDLPDLELLHETGGVDDEPELLSVDLAVQASSDVRMGPEQARQVALSGAARLLMGLNFSPTAYLRLDSMLVLPVPTDGYGGAEDAGDLELHDLRGRHRLEGHVGLGPLERGALGVDIDLAAGVDHAPDILGYLQPEVGPAPFADGTLEAGLWLRRAIDEETAWVLPLRYQQRRVEYLEDVVNPGFVRHTLSSGLGLRGYGGPFADGWLELLGASYSRTELGADLDCGAEPCLAGLVGAGGGPSSPFFIDQLDLRVLSLDGLTIRVADGVSVGGNLQMGASWLWDDRHNRSETVFTFSFGEFVRVDTNSQSGWFGLSIARRGAHSPDGLQLFTDHRMEIGGGYENRDLGMGLSHRAIVDWLADPVIDTEEQPETRAGLESEWFLDVLGLDVGAYHNAFYGPGVGESNWDPRTQERRWTHEVGAFVRWEPFD